MSAPVSLSKQELMGSVVEALQLAGGKVPEDEKDFWRELASHFGLTLRSKDITRVAQAVLVSLDVEWDDDFIDDESRFALPLYESLEDAVRRYETARLSGEPPEDEEDDESLSGFKDERVAPVTYGLETVHEWIKSGTLVLSPEWQRNFVWKSKKMKRFIESILLGLPIPSFLIFEDSTTGKRYVIDGRQRLETIARFKAPKEKKGEDRLRFRTFNKREPGWCPGEQLADAADKFYDQLDQRFRTRIDSAPLVVAEFRDISLASLYQVFKRYNTGAVALNAAEIRNAVYQASPLHQMMFRFAGEQRGASHKDDDERLVADDLRETMQRKVQRYGAYDFLGRYFAFAYQVRGSVAKATLEFMDAYAKADARNIEQLRGEFIRVFRTAQKLYSAFLTDAREDRFHAFLATLQLVSTKFMLEHVDAGRSSLDELTAQVKKDWRSFADNRLARKQNSTLFWASQKTWVTMLETGLGLPLRYPDHDWEGDLEPPTDGAR